MEKSSYQLLYQLAKSLQKHSHQSQAALDCLLSQSAAILGAKIACLVCISDIKQVEAVQVLGLQGLDLPRTYWQEALQGGFLGHVYYSGQTLAIRNIQKDPRWSLWNNHPKIVQGGSAVGVPLRQGQRIYAVLVYFHDEIDYFGKDRLKILEEIADLGSELFYQAQDSKDTPYKALFESTLMPMLLSKLDGTILESNVQACELLGFSSKDLVGIPLQDLNILWQAKHGVEALEEGEEVYFRSTLYDIDGREIPTLVRARRSLIKGQTVLEWMLQDIRAQMELEQLRRDLAAMVYHDLRVPLNNVLAGTRYVSDNSQDAHPVMQRILALSLRSAQQLERMIDGLLDIQRFEEKSAMLNKTTVQVPRLIDDTIQLTEALAHDAQQTIRAYVPPDLPATQADADMILRVLVNLVENAIKYTPESGVIGIHAKANTREIRISISDSGPGIPRPLQNQIFDKFSRVKYRNVPKGVGLGLAFCRLAIEAHGGRIWVESDGSSGSDFIFTLPIYQVNAPKKEAVSAAEQPDESSENRASA